MKINERKLKQKMNKAIKLNVENLLSFKAYPITKIELDIETVIPMINIAITNSYATITLIHKGIKYDFIIKFVYFNNDNIEIIDSYSLCKTKNDGLFILLIDEVELKQEILKCINNNDNYQYIYYNICKRERKRANDNISRKISKISKVNKLFIHVGKGKIKWIDSYKNIIAEGSIDKYDIISDIKLSNGKYLNLDETCKLIKYITL